MRLAVRDLAAQDTASLMAGSVRFPDPAATR
jgi:hypothetical protein